MPISSKYFCDFYENGVFHVYNRTSNGQLLFHDDNNRLFFLKQYAKYLSPLLDTYCWNLLPNHFHLLVRIKPVEVIQSFLLIKAGPIQEDALQLSPLISITEKKFLLSEITLSELVEHAFRNFFQSYSLAFNKANQKKGNLFYKSFKRLELTMDTYFTQAILFIHVNAQKHRLCKHFTQYKWSSYHQLVSNQPTSLCREEMWEWFGGRGAFINAHLDMANQIHDAGVTIEEA